MVEIEVDYEGQLHCNAKHGPSAAELPTDAPTDNQGKGEAFVRNVSRIGRCMRTRSCPGGRKQARAPVPQESNGKRVRVLVPPEFASGIDPQEGNIAGFGIAAGRFFEDSARANGLFDSVGLRPFVLIP